MAANKTSTPADRLGSAERTSAALEASYEVQVIAATLLRHAEENRSSDCGELLTRALAHRLDALSSAIVSALGDEGEPITEIRLHLTGIREEMQPVH